MPGVSPPATTSKAATAAGVGGAGVAIYLIDRLLADDGQVAATMLTRLSPLLGPVWASWPMLVILGLIAWIGYDKWSAAVAASQASATALAASVGDVATGLGGLRREVHELRGALQDHAAATDERMRHHESGLAEVRSEVGQVRERVDVLELGPRAQPRPRARRPS